MNDGKAQAMDRLVEAILRKDKYAVAAELQESILTPKEQAHAFVIAAQETVRAGLEATP